MIVNIVKISELTTNIIHDYLVTLFTVAKSPL